MTYRPAVGHRCVWGRIDSRGAQICNLLSDIFFLQFMVGNQAYFEMSLNINIA